MLRDMPDALREVKTNYRAQDTGDDAPVKTEIPDSADSESTESAIGNLKFFYTYSIFFLFYVKCILICEHFFKHAVQ